MSSTLAGPPIDRSTPPPIDGDHGGGDGGGGDRRGRRWVTLCAFLHPAQAHIARLRLEAAGVACVLLDEMTAATHCLSLAVGGVKLQVPAADAARAADLLAGLLPERPTPPIAAYAARQPAVMAACVVEAIGVAATVREHARAWSLVADDGIRAARSLADSPFAGGLTGVGIAALSRQSCPDCGSRRSRPTWRSGGRVASWPGVGSLRGRVASLLAPRRCRDCGRRW